MRADAYSRMVAWLKVLLPLTALAILSTLFLLSRSKDPATSIPFADSEITDRVLDQQITKPFFSGTTNSGDQINFTASIVKPAQSGTTMTEAQDLTAWLDLKNGQRIVLKSKTGTIDMPANRAEFIGDVHIRTSAGYDVDSQHLIAKLGIVDLTSPGDVSAVGPPGNITAGTMQLSTDPDTQNTHLVFTNRVKLIYDPKQIER